MAKLVEEFGLFDRFFASHPGPTWPNRLFQLMGTSKGCTETSHWDPETFLYDGKTVFDVVEDAGHDWKFYYADVPLELAMLEKLVEHPGKVHGWDRFKKDVREGDLPAFSWVSRAICRHLPPPLFFATAMARKTPMGGGGGVKPP